MADWVFCVSCSSTVTSGDFDDGAFWWNATTATSYSLYPDNQPAYTPQLTPGDNVYWAVQVDANGVSNFLTTDVRAAIGRKRGGATISSPFQSNGRSQQNVGGAPSALSVAAGGTLPQGTFVAVGPYAVSGDPGRSGQTSEYEFVMTVTLTNQNQFGEDPEIDVENGM
jgi:hypothetical protein